MSSFQRWWTCCGPGCWRTTRRTGDESIRWVRVRTGIVTVLTNSDIYPMTVKDRDLIWLQDVFTVSPPGSAAAGLFDQERLWKSGDQRQRTHLWPAISRKLSLHRCVPALIVFLFFLNYLFCSVVTRVCKMFVSIYRRERERSGHQCASKSEGDGGVRPGWRQVEGGEEESQEEQRQIHRCLLWQHGREWRWRRRIRSRRRRRSEPKELYVM